MEPITKRHPKCTRFAFAIVACTIVCFGATPQANSQWAQATGIGSPAENGNTYIGGITPYGTNGITVLAAEGGYSTPDSVWFSTNDGQSWTLRSGNVPILASGFVDLGSVIVLASGNPGGILYSTDGGRNWNPDTTGFLNQPGTSLQYYVNSMVNLGTTVYAGTGIGLCQQAQPGAQWTPDTAAAMGLGSVPIEDLFVSGNDLFAEVAFMGFFVSTDGGMSWKTANVGLPSSGQFVAAGKTTLMGSTMFTLLSDTANGGYSTDIYRTETNSIDWHRMNSTPILASGVYAMTASGGYVICVTDSGIFASTNNGVTWTKSNTGLPPSNANNPFTAVALSGKNAVLGSFSNGIWYRKLSDFGAPSFVNGASSNNSHLLLQSFPNPANAVSTIQYSLPSSGIATLKVYNVTGQEIAELARGYQAAGLHTARFDGTALPAGIYYYRLTAGNQSSAHWLQLIK